MLKRLLLVCVLLLPLVSTASPVRVVGAGVNYEDAKKDAFRRAVELSIGSLIVSNFETQEGQIQRNEVLNYSSGYIDRFTVVQQWNENGRTKLLVDVWVQDSKIASRILKEERTTNIDGWQLKEQYSTYNNARLGADSIVKTAFVKYPENSFKVDVIKTEFLLDNRSPILNIHYRLMFNQNWLDGFRESLLAAANFKDLKNMAGVVLFYDNPNGLFEFRRWTHYTYNEDNIVYLLRRQLNETPAALRVELLRGAMPIHSRCLPMQDHYFLGIDGMYNSVPAVKFYPKNVYSGTFEYGLGGIINSMDQVTGIRMTAVKLNTCYGQFNK